MNRLKNWANSLLNPLFLDFIESNTGIHTNSPYRSTVPWHQPKAMQSLTEGIKMFRTTSMVCLALGMTWSLPATGQEKTIVETAIGAGQFQTLVAAVKAAGLAETLGNRHKQFTVFAPTDQAFAKLPKGTVEELLKPSNKDKLTRILTFHVLAGAVKARTAYPLDQATTLSGQPVEISLRGKDAKIGAAKLVTTDIECANGVIHVIDQVLLPTHDSIPEVAAKNGSFKTLLAAVTTAELASVLSGPGPFTVFAPTDQAFGKLPKGTVEELLKPENRQKLVEILKLHVVPGRVSDRAAVKLAKASALSGRTLDFSVSEKGLFVSGAKVIAANVPAANGTIHVIDQVLLPKKYSVSQVMAMLESTVDRGSTYFNRGHHSRCAEMYMATLEELVGAGMEGASESTMQNLRAVITEAKGTRSSRSQAWILRGGIDSIYGKMSRLR
ncbi:MAG: fasciclin domain-containing protein [Planctomycetota bacterium]|nr:fasciclin domain-containing protein [Planctomycetota bacterium]